MFKLYLITCQDFEVFSKSNKLQTVDMVAKYRKIPHIRVNRIFQHLITLKRFPHPKTKLFNFEKERVHDKIIQFHE